MEKINDILFIEGRGYDSNVYIFDGIIVDTGTGENIDFLVQSLEYEGIIIDDLELIVNTHNHFDHTGGNRYIDLKVAMHEADAIPYEQGDDLATAASMFGQSMGPMRVDKKLQEGDTIGQFKVLHTPGHTAGGICLFDGENLISGDTVFAGGGFGRYDLGGNLEDLKNSLNLLNELEVQYLLPGHGPAVNNANDHLEASNSIIQRL